MKNLLNQQFLIIVLLLTSGLFLSFTQVNKNQQQSEQYALVYVEDKGKVKTMSISKSGEETAITILKVSKKEDYSGVANALADLNKEGYELVSSSIAGMNGYLFYSYSLKKSI